MNEIEIKAKELIQDLDKHFEEHYASEETVKELAVDKCQSIIDELELTANYCDIIPLKHVQLRISFYKSVIKAIEQ